MTAREATKCARTFSAQAASICAGVDILGPAGDLDARVAVQHVYPAVIGCDAVDLALDRRVVAHVQHPRRPLPARCADRLYRLFGQGQIQIAHHHEGAFARHRHGAGATNPRSCGGHQRNAVLQHCSLLHLNYLRALA